MSETATPPVSMLMFAAAAFFGALGQFLYKSGAERLDVGRVLTWFNPRLLAGVVCYVAVMVLFVAAFKRGGQLTTLYPIYASTFIWAAVIAYFAFAEPIRPANIAGMVLLIAGMWLMGRR